MFSALLISDLLISLLLGFIIALDSTFVDAAFMQLCIIVHRYMG